MKRFDFAKRGSYLFIFTFTLLISFLSLVSAGELRVTQEHPFLVDGEWISASQLEVGDLLTTPSGEKVRITSLEDIVTQDNFLVYNMEVENYSNFIVSSDNLSVVVHNSKVPPEIPPEDIRPVCQPTEKLTRERLVQLLTKPGKRGVSDAAEVQATDALDLIDHVSKPYKQNFKVAIEAHIESLERGSPNELTRTPKIQEQIAIFKRVLAALDNPSGLTAGGSTTPTRATGDYAVLYQNARRYYFKSSNAAEVFPTKAFILTDANGVTKQVHIDYKLKYDPVNDIVQIYSWGGVESDFSISLDDALLVMDKLTKTAVSAPTKIQRAIAIAEFEWVHSAITPSIFGGGTVLAMEDYVLLDQAGFKIAECSFRRVELEAQGTPYSRWMVSRIKDLMMNYFMLGFLRSVSWT